MDDHAAPDETPEVESPEFGPRGYLPDRASRRARKIVLRAPMGIQWVIGALVVGVVVAVAGFLLLRDEPPAAPFTALDGALPSSATAVVLDPPELDDAVLFVGVGRPRVFELPAGDPPVYCDSSGLLEADDGRAWRVTGRGLGGTTSLAEHPTVIDDGVLFVDPTTTIDAPASDDAPAETACTG